MSDSQDSKRSLLIRFPDKADLFCYDLPTKPRKDIGKVLVTGATGYIGGRLVPELLERGYQVRVMVRGLSSSSKAPGPGMEIIEADALNLSSLRKALVGIDTAYYLIHSLMQGPREFETADLQAANNFRRAAEENEVKRIIYLGGLGEVKTLKSPHLQSRVQVADELLRGKIPVTILRAAIIIGSGSSSYEI
ncbi:MAG: NAD(P)H-binding protein, partial [Deltaproteobacteria bacterium]